MITQFVLAAGLALSTALAAHSQLAGTEGNGQQGYEGQPGNQGNGKNGYEGQPGNQGNGQNGYEGQPGNQGGKHGR